MSLCASVLTPDATLLTAIKMCNTMKMGDRLNRTTFNYNMSHCMSVAQVTHHPVMAIAGPALWHFALRPSTISGLSALTVMTSLGLQEMSDCKPCSFGMLRLPSFSQAGIGRPVVLLRNCATRTLLMGTA